MGGRASKAGLGGAELQCLISTTGCSARELQAWHALYSRAAGQGRLLSPDR